MFVYAKAVDLYVCFCYKFLNKLNFQGQNNKTNLKFIPKVIFDSAFVWLLVVLLTQEYLHKHLEIGYYLNSGYCFVRW